MKLGSAGGLSVADYFATFDTIQESGRDEDLGSGGALCCLTCLTHSMPFIIWWWEPERIRTSMSPTETTWENMILVGEMQCLPVATGCVAWWRMVYASLLHQYHLLWLCRRSFKSLWHHECQAFDVTHQPDREAAFLILARPLPSREQ